MKPCVKCGASDRYASGKCRPCNVVRAAAWRLAHPDQAKAGVVAWCAANRTRLNRSTQLRHKRQYATNELFRLKSVLRARMFGALRLGAKTGSAVRDLGCTVPELRLHLEKLFQPGMTWENWGRGGWHVDHIKPLASFDLTDREQFLKACHYTNLQPLWAEENLKKGDRHDAAA